MTSVQILLAVLNGERFLQEQLDSISDQTVETIHLLASDDGSTDGSMAILRKAQETWTKGRFEIIEGPRDGFARNFRHLVLECDGSADHYAFCDQDDVWRRDKFETAIAYCPNTPPDKARVFASRTELIDKDGAPIGYSPPRTRAPSVRNAILQNIASGNTIVMNRAAHRLLVRTANQMGPLPHDHWLYLITTASGGRFHYSEELTVRYRQHEHNTLARNVSSWRRFLWRFNRYLTGQMRDRTARCIAALESCEPVLTPEARKVLSGCKTMHDSDSVIARLTALRRSGIYRSSAVGQLGLWIDCLFKLR